METITKINKTPKKILEAVNKYQQENKEAVNAKMRRYYDRNKLLVDPVRHQKMKDRHKLNYLNKKALLNLQ